MEIHGSNSIKAFARAKERKDDEWYTQYKDIEREITEEYFPFFAGKRVLCPCDDYWKSNFTQFFVKNFQRFQLKSLTSIGIEGFYHEYDGNRFFTARVNGDFRSKDTLNAIKQSDIIVTNPPFSLITTFVSFLFSTGKQFLLILPSSCFHYVSVFRNFQKKRIWVGKGRPGNASGEWHMNFLRPDGTLMGLGNVCWVTNIPYNGYLREIPLVDRKDIPPVIDGTNIPCFDRILELPRDYMDLMAVPTTVFKYNPLRQFSYHWVLNDVQVNGKSKFSRVIVSRLEESQCHK